MQQLLSESEIDAIMDALEGQERVPIIDSLTGLFNRKTFEKRFKNELEQAKENDQITSFIFLDIDHFTQINAEFGHEFGDAVLKHVSKNIVDLAGPNAISARYGGEEFVILLPGTEREQAFLIAEKIRGILDGENELEVSGKKEGISISISGGVAAFPTDGQNESEIIRKVDQALYRAKKTGRNKICIAQEEKMATKTTHYTLTQLERLAKLAKEENHGEAVLLREALDDLLFKYKIAEIES